MATETSTGTEKEFRLHLFGGPTLKARDAPLGLSPLEASVLGIVYGGEIGFVTREEVIALLWPEELPAKARRRLNQLLYSFKKKTGTPQPFEVEGEEIHRDVKRTRSDVHDFTQALEWGDLSQAANLLSLGFLKRVDGQVTRALSDWIASREAHLRTDLRRRAQRLLARSEQDGHWTKAREAAETLLALNPDDERVLRAVMKTAGSHGSVLDAESALNEFKAAIEKKTERPWTPSEETSLLLERLRSNNPAPEGSIPGLTASETHEPELVGREEEHRLLRRTLYSPPHEALRGILITGEAGIGKTRLIKEALRGIGLEGQRVFWAGLSEFEQLIPLNPIIEAFRDPSVGELVQAVEDPWKTVLYGVMPHHYPGRGPIPHAPEVQPGSVSWRLFEAILRMLTAVCETEPAILVIEDLHWADDTTLAALEFLFRRWDRGRFQIVISVRWEDVSRNSPAERFLEKLRAHRDFVTLDLEQLNGGKSQELIEAVAKRRFDDDETAFLRALAGGNPFFLIELTLEYLAGRIDEFNSPTDSLQIPVSIKQVLRQRLTHLSPLPERILNAVSVHTRPMGIEDLSRVLGTPEEEIIAGLDQLHHFRLIRSRRAQVTPSHGLIRQTVYQRMNESGKAWLHERIARALQMEDHQPPPDELAVHFHAAGASEEALRYALDAAGRAEESGATPEALRFLTIAREHTSAPEKVSQVLGRMGHLNYLHQNMREAAPLLENAAKRLRAQQDYGLALGYEVERVEALSKSGLLPIHECLDELSRIKEETAALEEWEVLTRALDAEAHIFDQLGSINRARATIREAEQLTGVSSPKARCRAQAIIALNLYFGDPEDGLAAAKKAVKTAMETDCQDLQLHALNRLMVVLLYQARLHTPEGEGVLAAIEARFGSSGDLLLKFFVKLNLALWHLEIGEYSKARVLFPAAEKVIRGTEARGAMLTLLVNRAELYFALGETTKSRRDYLEAANLLTPASPIHFETVISAGLGRCALHEGDLSTAKHLASKLPDLPDYWVFDPSVVAAFNADMLRMRGDHRRAIDELARVAEGVRNRFVTAWFKLTHQQATLLRRLDPEKGRHVAQLGAEAATELGLRVRKEEFLRLARAT